MDGVHVSRCPRCEVVKAGDWNTSSEYFHNAGEDPAPTVCGGCENMNEGETDGFGEKARRTAQESWRYIGQHRAFGRG